MNDPAPATLTIEAQIAQALREVPRESFLAKSGDGTLVVARPSRSMPSRRVVAALLGAAQVAHGQRVLHVGAGSGYLSAVLSRLVRSVYAIDKVGPMAEQASRRLEALGFANVVLRVGNGFDGWQEEAPFHSIIITTPCHGAPPRLLNQLRSDGVLVYADGPDRMHQTVFRVTRDGLGHTQTTELGIMDLNASDAPLDALASSTSSDDRTRLRDLAQRHGLLIAEVDVLLGDLDQSLGDILPRAWLAHNHVLPISKRHNVLRVAVTDPLAPLEDLHRVFPTRMIEAYLVSPGEFQRLWSTVELTRTGSTRIERSASTAAAPADLVDSLTSTSKERMIKLFETLMLEAIEKRASDLHLERYGDTVRARLRIDGELRDCTTLKLAVDELIGLVNVIKVKANCDIAEHRLPQGGRIHLRSGGKTFDLRVQTQPTLHGEHVVIRILAQDAQLVSMADLGFAPVLASTYRRLLNHPAGLVLVVGPTGSGKSTTLYAGLRELATDTSRKVLTIEDPIEYSIAGVQQSAVRPEIGFGFAQAMRSFVRQDPDVILVGEIRDTETALEAIRASQTGHLVLSTLHCNDATDAVQRLRDLGMHPNSIASELLAVLAQRLAKRICPHCATTTTPDPQIMAELFAHQHPPALACRVGAGCPACSNAGTRGRIAVIELLRIDKALRHAIHTGGDADELRRAALAGGMVSLRNAALELVRAGTIPLGELPLMLTAERMAG